MKPKNNKKQKESSKEFEVDLFMGSQESGTASKFSSSGDSVLECLEQLKPEVFKARGVLIARHGTQTSKVILRPIFIRRMTVQPVMREILAKRLSTFFQ